MAVWRSHIDMTWLDGVGIADMAPRERAGSTENPGKSASNRSGKVHHHKNRSRKIRRETTQDFGHGLNASGRSSHYYNVPASHLCSIARLLSYRSLHRVANHRGSEVMGITVSAESWRQFDSVPRPMQ